MRKLGMRHWVLLFCVLVVSASFLAMAENETKAKATEAREKIITITDVPSGVRAVIEKSAEGGEIKEIEMNNENGKIFYTADIVKNGKTQEISVAADGTLMKEADEEKGNKEEEGKEEEGEEEQAGEQKIDFKDVPQPVKDAAAKILGSAGPFTASVETEEDVKVFEVATEKDGMASSINASEDGTLLEIEKQIPINEAPKNVLSELEEKYPKAKVQKVTLVQTFTYEVELAVSKEVKVSSTGEINKGKGEEGKEEGKKEWGNKEENKKEEGGKMKEKSEKKGQKEEEEKDSD